MIGVFGDSNTGKSTLINAILGQRLLPQSHSCSTSLFASVTLVDTEVPRAKLPRGDGSPPEQLEGRREILKRLVELNGTHRHEPLAIGSGSISPRLDLEVAMLARASSTVCNAGVCDGTLTLVDTPGQDEEDGPVSEGQLDSILSLCHGVIVVIRHDRVRSKTLAALLDRIVVHAPFLLSGEGAVTLVVSQVDTLRSDEDVSDDEQSEDSSCHGLLDNVKQELRSFLLGRPILAAFPGFAREVRIWGISVDGRLQGRHEFPCLVGTVVSLHAQAQELQRNRRVRLCEAMYANFCDELLDTRNRHPVRAQAILEAQTCKEGLDVGLTAISAVATMISIPLGGLASSIGCATIIALTGIALGVSMAAGAAKALDLPQSVMDLLAHREGPELCGEATLDGRTFGAIGAYEANRQINFVANANDVLEGKVYVDTLIGCRGMPLYIGSFSKNVPQGPGRLFWPNTGFEAFIGEFEYGLPSRGIFLDERCCVVGHMRVGLSGHLEEITANMVSPRVVSQACTDIF